MMVTLGARGSSEAKVGAKKGTFSVFKTALKTRRGSLARVLGRIGVARRCDATRRDATRGGAIRSDPKARPDETVDEASRGA